MFPFLPDRFRRGAQPDDKPKTPSKINKKVTPVLQYFASIACAHPIYTICVVAVLASTTYVGIVKDSLYDATRSVRNAEWSSLTEGSRSLVVGPETSWKWQSLDPDVASPSDADHLALITFVFPESNEEGPQTAPKSHIVPMPSNLSITHLPSTSNPLTAYSQDTALAFAVKWSEAPAFVAAAQEIPNDMPGQEPLETATGKEHKMWIMKVAGTNARTSFVRWVHNAWTEFLDLLKNAEWLDIGIMSIGYLSMHSIFVSLFWRMRGLGSNVWLASSVLLSSVFAFLFGLYVTWRLGVPVSVVLLSEGLPFLVNVIGFEKNIIFTKAVLTHALDRRPEEQDPKSAKASKSPSPEGVIQYAVQKAIKEQGFEIVKNYAIEISVLILGAASGIQGGLQQFCFLSAWILFFDCILLFTFYTAILCIKLEINRIKRHVEMRRALEDDGLSRRVAENVAKSNDWPRGTEKGKGNAPLFGRDMESTSIPKFKFWMVATFFAINILNLCTIPFRTPGATSAWTGGLGGVVTTPTVDPFKVAANALDEVLFMARGHGRTTVVTVLTPIKYELEYPSVHYAVPSANSTLGYMGGNFTQLEGYGVGGQLVGSIIQSLEDPVLMKCVIGALLLSTILNAYLFNVARSGIKDPNEPTHPIDPKELAEAEQFNGSQSAALLPVGLASRLPEPKPLTPQTTDDEADALSMKKSAKSALEAPKAPVMSHSQVQLDEMLKEKRIYDMTDDEIVALSIKGKIPGYSLEKSLKDCTRAVKIRRAVIARTPATADLTGFLDRCKLPYENYNWEQVLGACCENVIGYMPIPVGVAGPMVIDGQSYFIPMATTEGVLVASTSRGCKAINAGGGAVTVLTHDGMTRGPCVGFETLERAGAAKLWLDSEAGQTVMKKAFNSTSRFARLQSMKTAIAGTNLYIRFKTTTGDAMGMNMISKGVEHALNVMATDGGFDDMAIISVSGNYCTDKKAAAINWIEGRGKGIVAEAIIPADVVKNVLKSDVDSLVELNVAKNLVGSAMAGSVGGFNAHAANIVAAIFLATGQDPAQVVESANCITLMRNLHGSLQISVSMPSIEVGTLGGGTILEPQGAMLDMFGVRGSHPTSPGDNARRLARIIGAAVLAGELSLCSALAAGHLVRAHMAHNRSAPVTRSTTPAPGANGAMTPVSLTMTQAADKTRSAAANERAKR